MKKFSMKRLKELRALPLLSGELVRPADLSEVRDRSHGVVGKFFRPAKNSRTRRQAQPRRESK
jgi:hypothetical protein